MTDNHPASGLEFEESIPVKTLRDEIAISVLNGLITAGFDVKVIPANAYKLADLMIDKMQKVKSDATPTPPNAALLSCLNDAINLWDAQNPNNHDDINKWREVAQQGKHDIQYIGDAIVKAIGDILYLAHRYEKVAKFQNVIDELTCVLNNLGLNEDDEAALRNSTKE